MKKIFELAKFVIIGTKDKPEGNKLILSKILEEVNKSIQAHGELEPLIFMREKAEYIVENIDNEFSFELVEMYTHHLLSFIYDVQENMEEKNDIVDDILNEIGTVIK